MLLEKGVAPVDYEQFLQEKTIVFENSGFEIMRDILHPSLFDFQRDLVTWAIRKGVCAIFADTGLGKTRMQLEWARLVHLNEDCPVLIIAPLSVARQTVREGKEIGINVHYSRSGDDIRDITITNYEMIDKFDPDSFVGVVLDESSILKSLDGKTRQKLIDMFGGIRYKLACTATPAPNDIAEMANHAEFLGIMTRTEMLAAFFVHDQDGWRLKGHAKDSFFHWLASWGMSLRKPSDLGYDDDGYILPPLNIAPNFIRSDYRPEGQLFFTGLKGISDRSKVRKATFEERCVAAMNLINQSDEQWIVWCELNDEANMMKVLVPEAENLQGSDSIERKVNVIEDFQDGNVRVLVTKPKIAGMGMNFQNSHNMIFVGLSDSFEKYYQCIRRQYRFGQDKPVNVYIVISDAEQEIYQNVMRKEEAAKTMSDELIKNVQQYEQEEIAGMGHQDFSYKTDDATGEGWTIKLGDSCERLAELGEDSIDLSVFSPPFASLYTYSPSERDLGNNSFVSRGNHTEMPEFFHHFAYIIRELFRVTKPGRICACHIADVTSTLTSHGYIGVIDLSGLVIDAFQREGWIFDGRVTIDKNPQAQAIRTHSKALLFVQMRKDSTWSRPALADYIVRFRKPGDNEVPVQPVANGELNNENWIEWAHPVWYGIQESDTLQGWQKARGNDDERHICPLQLGVIERCIKLWSNPGETVLSPFAGIGSEGYEAVRLGRKFIGIELKPEYWNVAVKNLKRIERENKTVDLFEFAGIDVSQNGSAK